MCLTPRDIPSRKEEHAQGHRGLNKCVTAGLTQWFPAGKQQGARATQESLSLSKECVLPRGQKEVSEGF